MTNVVELIPADVDWEPRTEMDFVFDRLTPTLQCIADGVGDVEDFERAIPVLEELIADFRQAKRKGSRLTA